MAANEYLQAAAGQLQSAANALKTEIDQMRGELMTYERQATKEIDSKEADIHAINARLVMDQSTATQHAMRIRIKMLQKEIDSKKREMADRKSKVESAIKGKEGAINGLMNQSRSLQGQAASLK